MHTPELHGLGTFLAMSISLGTAAISIRFDELADYDLREAQANEVL